MKTKRLLTALSIVLFFAMGCPPPPDCGVGQDGDSDGVCDVMDNCTVVPNNGQRDTNANGFGNICDPDFNNDGIVGEQDSVILSNLWGKTVGDPAFNPDVDLDGDNMIGQEDYDIMMLYWGDQPGPSSFPCAGTIPCMLPECTTGPDQDGDGVCNNQDSCLIELNPFQRDTNQDGYGNICDPDVNNDGMVGGPDFVILQIEWGKTLGDPDYDPDVDLDGDGVIGQGDYDIMLLYWGGQPGPSGLTCAGTSPCP
jgi:hypothetical protein